jgi:hypothetical protein
MHVCKDGCRDFEIAHPTAAFIGSHQISREPRKRVLFALGETVLDADVLPIDPAVFLHPLAKCLQLSPQPLSYERRQARENQCAEVSSPAARWPRAATSPPRDQQLSPSDGDCQTPLPCEARKTRIPRHERAVLTFKEGRMLVAPPSRIRDLHDENVHRLLPAIIRWMCAVAEQSPRRRGRARWAGCGRPRHQPCGQG